MIFWQRYDRFTGSFTVVKSAHGRIQNFIRNHKLAVRIGGIEGADAMCLLECIFISNSMRICSMLNIYIHATYHMQNFEETICIALQESKKIKNMNWNKNRREYISCNEKMPLPWHDDPRDNCASWYRLSFLYGLLEML